MTTKHSYRTGRVVALVAAVAAMSATIMSVTPSGAISATPSAQPTPAATRPASAAVRPAAARLSMAVLPTIDLCARAGSTTLPNGAVVQAWGYELGDCTGANTITKPGGPVISVTAGDVVTIALHNGLSETTSLLFQGQAIPPDTAGAAAAGTKTYTFTATNPGTFLYEAGFATGNNTQHQVAMGLYGALIVRPTAPNQAYGASTTFNDEGVLVLGDIDTALNNAANKANFDMRNFKAKYHTINGKAYSATDPIASAAGNTVLLRYVNAGITYHSMALLGASQKIIAYDGRALTYPHRVSAETFGPGQTADALVSIPAGTVVGSKFAIYDGNLLLNNSTASGFGGTMAFINIGTGTGGGDTSGPATTGVAASPNPTNGAANVTLTASVSEATTGGANIQAAEYRIDGGTASPMTATDASFDSPTEAVTATISSATLTSLASGSHNLFVRGQDSLGNWGPWNFIALNLDMAGPASTGLTLTPNPSNGLNVALHATGSDAGTGGSVIDAAEYFIDVVGADGTGNVMTVNVPGSTASLDAVIAGPLSSGSHTISVHAHDAQGNWGPLATISLVVDSTGPTTSGVSANPAASNGSFGYNSSTAAVRIFATGTDASSKVVAAEGFIDTVGANGTGFPFVPTDGLWSSLSEGVSADIPLTTVNLLSVGSHTIYVRSKDAIGNWGATATTTLIVDKTLPSTSSASVTPSPTAGAANVTLSVIGTDTGGAGINRAEWWIGTDPGAGLANQITNVTGTGPYTVSGAINTIPLAEGNHTIRARVRDAAGNWSTNTVTTTLTVTRPLWYSTDTNNVPSGAGGTGDDSDIYRWSGTAHSRTVDVTAIVNPVPVGANVDGLEFTDATHFYLSFVTDTTLAGVGLVQDEDIVFYNAGVWSVFFDGTTHGLNLSANQDIDEFAIVGSNIYYSTTGSTNPTGVGGTADDADIYLWNGTTTTRFFDASVAGLPSSGGGNANVDGISVVDSTHFFLSFTGAVTVPGIGGVADEDVVFYNAGTFSLYFDGSTHSLGTFDLDAIDV